MNNYDDLSRAELIEKIKDYKLQEECAKYTARVYAPDKSYKELEEKLTILEEEKKTVTDRLMASMSQMNKEVQSLRQTNYNLKSTNIDLKQTIEKQNVIITLAAGYISSTPQFSNTHPIDVKKWLMGGME